MFGKNIRSVECPDHGDQIIVRKATGREVTEMILGIKLPDVSDNDVCPF